MGGMVLLLVTVPLTGPAIAVYIHAGSLLAPAQAVGTLLMIVLAAAYLAGAWVARPAPAIAEPT